MSSNNYISSDWKSEGITLGFVVFSQTASFPTNSEQFLFQHWWNLHSLWADYCRCHTIFLWCFLSQQSCSLCLLLPLFDGSSSPSSNGRPRECTGSWSTNFISPFLFWLMRSSQYVFFHPLTVLSFNSRHWFVLKCCKAATMSFSAAYLAIFTFWMAVIVLLYGLPFFRLASVTARVLANSFWTVPAIERGTTFSKIWPNAHLCTRYGQMDVLFHQLKQSARWKRNKETSDVSIRLPND